MRISACPLYVFFYLNFTSDNGTNERIQSARVDFRCLGPRVPDQFTNRISKRFLSPFTSSPIPPPEPSSCSTLWIGRASSFISSSCIHQGVASVGASPAALWFLAPSKKAVSRGKYVNVFASPVVVLADKVEDFAHDCLRDFGGFIKVSVGGCDGPRIASENLFSLRMTYGRQGVRCKAQSAE